MFNWIKKQRNTTTKPPASAPLDTRIYAIGDIHGRFDLLQKMHDAIKADLLTCDSSNIQIIYVGDYIDRGFQSKEVVECLTNHPQLTDINCDIIFLKGNHEHALLEFLRTPETITPWLLWGGEVTLQSYGVPLRNAEGKRTDCHEQSTKLKEVLPDNHQAFFDDLKLYYEAGDYLFVHAGIKPGVPLNKQHEEDLLMIRDAFIFSRKTLEKTVVFGHTIFTEPFVTEDRIGIDTGGYAHGKLTAVALEGTDKRFITVG